MSNKVFPVGAIIFLHGECPAEHVPYMTEAAMVEAFRSAVNAKLNPNTVWTYVEPHRIDLAKKLFAIMKEGYGEVYDVYALTPENIHVVLADYTFVIPIQTAQQA